MKRILQRLGRFFFPPEGTPTWLRVLPYALLGVLTVLLLTGAIYGWDYTNSSEFCGTACHSMPPEYTAYLVSPHARVQCVECHIGRGFFATRFTRKAGDVKHVIDTISQNYEYPIVAADLRPARETCERCHSPEKFSDDTFKQINYYGTDVNNTAYTIYLNLKTGGGTEREGLGKGIHWHIENQVYYLPTDAEEQDIPYVKVVADDGTVTTYKEIGLDITPADIDTSAMKEMDCITCHNRITHLVYTPAESVDQLLSRGLISTTIPEIKQRAVDALDQTYQHYSLGLDSIASSTTTTKWPILTSTPRTRPLIPRRSTSFARRTSRACSRIRRPTGPAIPTMSATRTRRDASAAMTANTWTTRVRPSAWSAIFATPSLSLPVQAI